MSKTLFEKQIQEKGQVLSIDEWNVICKRSKEVWDKIRARKGWICIMPENKLLRCSKRKCGSHVFTIYKDATDQHVLICDLCHTPQYLNQLKIGSVAVSNMLKLVKKDK